MPNTVNLEFAGDAAKLAKAGKDATTATDKVGNSVTQAGSDFDAAAKQANNYNDRIGKLGAGVEGMSGAIDSAGAAVQALSDLQTQGIERAQRLARAANDVKQAQEDYNQSLRDGAQATIDTDQAAVDLTQAHIDQKTALKDYNEAVKEFGARSIEAQQAQNDMKQAGVDVKQAVEDQNQALRDASQANIDTTSATLDLAEAQRAAKPPEGIQKWAENIQFITPILSGLVGIVGLITAAQWLWNIAMTANPIGIIIVAVAALIAIIVLIATKTDWFQRAWRASWGWIKDAASNTWDFLKKIPGWIGDAFGKVAGFITLPFRTAFNFVADAWNNTIGSLSWSVPNWIPGIGGNTISVPDIPKFHSGIDSVPGAPGSEMLAILQAGERVTPANSSGCTNEMVHVTVMLGEDTLIEAIVRGVRERGGNVQFVLGA